MTRKTNQNASITLLFNTNGKEKKLKVSSKESLLIYSYIFKKNIRILDSEKAKEWLKNTDKFFNTKNIIENTNHILQCLEKINLSSVSNFKTKVVSKDMVHKISAANVMIAEIDLSVKTNVRLFSADVNRTNEIQLDHVNTEHVEAIFLTEVCRQASMVSLSKFLGSNSKYYIIEEFKKFKQIVKRDKKLIVHTLPIIGTKAKGRGLCLFTAYQEDK